MTSPTNQTETVVGEIEPDHDGRMLAIAIGILFGVEFVIILAIMLAVGANPRDIILVGMLAIAATIAALFVVTRLMWIPWQRKYPTQPVLADAVSKSMQSFGFPRLCWFNNCLRITADESHLHVCPFILCAPFGAKRISIPWNAITAVQPTIWPGVMKGRLEGLKFHGPDWCLKLTQSDPTTG